MLWMSNHESIDWQHFTWKVLYFLLRRQSKTTAATMKSYWILPLGVVLFCQLYGIHSEQFDVWGDLRRTPTVLGSSKTRYAFPFIKRTIEVKFPDVSVIEYRYNSLCIFSRIIAFFLHSRNLIVLMNLELSVELSIRVVWMKTVNQKRCSSMVELTNAQQQLK